jgi:hypothetical protein
LSAELETADEIYERLIRFKYDLYQKESISRAIDADLSDGQIAIVSHSLVGMVLTAEWPSTGHHRQLFLSQAEKPIPLPGNAIKPNNAQIMTADVYFDDL